jgi:molybdopterin/thiamine biosynthesis adenylyltransferase
LVIPQADLHAWAASRRLTLREAYTAALQAGLLPECWERNFPVLSPADQLLLWDSRALIVGLGGLGGCQATLLARAGVGFLLVADGDVFAPSNLNRQCLADLTTLGQNKAQTAADRLRKINPALEVHPVPAYLQAGTLVERLQQVDVALDALDSVPARRELFAACLETRRPLVHGAVAANFGQVATLLPGDEKFPGALYPAGKPSPEAAPAVLAPVVTLIAALQVQEALRLLLGRPPAYHRRLAHFDGETGHLEILPLGNEYP